ncbi:MAG: universal stress protein [Rhodoferax sp.]|nr:universal stress protein [Rhodoferax sp.]
MFKHILVPIDGSPTSELAVDKAIGLARAFDSAVTAIYVVDPYPFTGVGADFAYGQGQYLNAAKAHATQALANARTAMEEAGVTITTATVEAHSVWRGILEAADSGGADLIVMGSHGRSGIEKLVLGNVAQRVTSHTRLPVLLVRA